jgi:hypothetical protein
MIETASISSHAVHNERWAVTRPTTLPFSSPRRRLGVTPYVSQNTNGQRSAIDRRTTRHSGHAISVRVRLEEVFGWIKRGVGLRKTHHRGTALVGWMFALAAAAYIVGRRPRLLAAAAQSRPEVCHAA